LLFEHCPNEVDERTEVLVRDLLMSDQSVKRVLPASEVAERGGTEVSKGALVAGRSLCRTSSVQFFWIPSSNHH
jgi:hypothetical protein